MIDGKDADIQNANVSAVQAKHVMNSLHPRLEEVSLEMSKLWQHHQRQNSESDSLLTRLLCTDRRTYKRKPIE